MKETLAAMGWVSYHECNTCSGHRLFYKHADHPGYEIRTKTRQQTFSILLNNMVIAGPFWGYQVEEKIKANVK